MVSIANTTVLIQGETGTGKELVAEALHVASGEKEIIFQSIALQFHLNYLDLSCLVMKKEHLLEQIKQGQEDLNKLIMAQFS